MAIKLTDSPARSHQTSCCPNKGCLLHWLPKELITPRLSIYRRGTILIEQGDPVLCCYSICSGFVIVTRRTVRGKVAGIDICGPGELLGARELLAQEPEFDTSAQTLSKTIAIRLDRVQLLELIRRRPEFLGEISRRVAQIAGAVQRRLSSALHASIEEKIAYLLSYLHEKQTFAQFGGGGGRLRTFVQSFSAILPPE